jgi:hypothetical protein
VDFYREPVNFHAEFRSEADKLPPEKTLKRPKKLGGKRNFMQPVDLPDNRDAYRYLLMYICRHGIY